MERPDRPTPRMIVEPLLIFGLLIAIYILTMSGHHYSVDGMAMYQQSKTLLFQQTLRFSPPFVWGTYSAEYTYWPEGQSIIYLIPLAIFSYLLLPNDASFRTLPQDSTSLLYDPSYLHISITNSIITALTASALFVVATTMGFSRRAALAAALVYGVASPAFAYQKQDFSQPLAGLLITTSVLLSLLAFSGGQTGRRPVYVALSSVCLGLLLMTRPEMLFLVISVFMLFSAFHIWRLARHERLLASAALLLPLIVLGLLHSSINYIKTGSIFEILGAVMTRDGGTFETKLFGLLVSPGRGLLVFFPLAIYAPFGLYRMHARQQTGWAAVFASMIALHIAFLSVWPIWWGGLSWGPRFFAPLLPILTLLAFWPPAAVPARPALVRALAALLKLLAIVIGLLMALSGVLLRWDVIESQQAPPEWQRWTLAEQGRWFLRLEANAVWTNWRDFGDWTKYDLLLLQPSGPDIIRGKLLAALAILLVVGGLLLLRRRMARR